METTIQEKNKNLLREKIKKIILTSTVSEKVKFTLKFKKENFSSALQTLLNFENYQFLLIKHRDMDRTSFLNYLRDCVLSNEWNEVFKYREIMIEINTNKLTANEFPLAILEGLEDVF